MEKDISKEICDKVLSSDSIAIWPIDENPLSDSHRIGRYFQDRDGGFTRFTTRWIAYLMKTATAISV
jgi:hypothetical protein